MPTDLAVIKAVIEDIKKIQKYMLLAKEENAEKYILASRPMAGRL